jgi:surface protein
MTHNLPESHTTISTDDDIVTLSSLIVTETRNVTITPVSDALDGENEQSTNLPAPTPFGTTSRSYDCSQDVYTVSNSLPSETNERMVSLPYFKNQVQSYNSGLQVGVPIRQQRSTLPQPQQSLVGDEFEDDVPLAQRYQPTTTLPSPKAQIRGTSDTHSRGREEPNGIQQRCITSSTPALSHDYDLPSGTEETQNRQGYGIDTNVGAFKIGGRNISRTEPEHDTADDDVSPPDLVPFKTRTYLAEAEAVAPYVVALEVSATTEVSNDNDKTSTLESFYDQSKISSLSKTTSTANASPRKRRCIIVLSLCLVLVAIAIAIAIVVLQRTNSGSGTGTYFFPIPDGVMLFDAIDDHLDRFVIVDSDKVNKESPYEVDYGLIHEWDVSKVRSFFKLLSSKRIGDRAFNFTADLSRWQLSSANDTRWMFHNCSIFKSDLSRWDVSSVIDMTTMFYKASQFESDLSKWNVSSAKQMESLFSYAQEFTSDLSLWDVSKVENMDYMFYNALKFDSDLSEWDVRRTISMKNMFVGAVSFVGIGLDKWKLNNEVNLTNMFCGAESFNKSYISSWNVTKWNLYC